MAENKSTKKPAKEPDKKPTKEQDKKPADKAEKTKSNKGPIIGIITALVLVVIGVAIALIVGNANTDPSDPLAKIDYSKSFFIYDDNKYTLWNADGKRVTEDEYDYQSNFVGGYAMVKKNDQYGIIKDNGAVSVEFGKYGSIANKGGLYLAQDGNTKEYFLITGNGKVLAQGEDLSAYTANDTSGLIATETEGKIKIFNYMGKLVAETDVVENAENPALNSSNDFGLVHYGDKNFLVDARTGALVAEFDGPRYTFDTVSDSRKAILLEDYDKGEVYKFITDGKVYDLNETKYYGLTDSDIVIGYDNYSEVALLDENYKVAKRVNDYLELKDINNYATLNDDGNVVIYQNGEMVKEYSDESDIGSSGILYEDYYAIKDGDKVKFYNLDGSVAIDHEFKNVLSLFDKNGNAIVADEDKVYYLINTKGERVSDASAKNISPRKGGYEFENNDKKSALVDKNGKSVTDFKYTDCYYRSYAEPLNIWTCQNGDKDYDVIDVNKGTVLLEHINPDSFYNNHFRVVNGDGGIDYYTYNGELFYTVKK